MSRQPRRPAKAAAKPASEESQELRIRRYQKRLRRLASQLSLAEARERREIASDLHDHIGQALAYVSQRLSRLQGDAVFSGLDIDISEIRTILKQTIEYTRDLTVAISPPVLYELGLSAALEWLAERTEKRHGLTAQARESGRVREVSEDVSAFLFKAVQELIANAAKHAAATQVVIKTTWKKDRLEVTVKDDGRGMDTTGLDSSQADSNCFGLFSIRERLSSIGGTMEVKSAPGEGTAVTLTAAYRIAAEEGDD